MKAFVILLIGLCGWTSASAATNMADIVRTGELAMARSNTLAIIAGGYGDKLLSQSGLSGMNRRAYSDIVASFFMADTYLADSRTNDAMVLYRRIMKKYPKGGQADDCAYRMLLLLDGIGGRPKVDSSPSLDERERDAER